MTEEDDKWRKMAADREQWKGMTKEDDKGRKKAADREKWTEITDEGVLQYVN